MIEPASRRGPAGLLFAFLAAAVLALALTASPGMAQQPATPPAAAEEAPSAPSAPSAADQARALVGVLQDEAARQALVAELERIAAGEAAPDAADAAEAAPEEDTVAESIGRRIALATQDSAQAIARSAASLWQQIARAPRTFSALDGAIDAGVLVDSVQALALVILATYGVFLILRFFARRLYRRMGRRAGAVGPVRTLALTAASVAVDAGAVALAWAAGYAIALSFFGVFGEIGIRQALYLNAFLAVEMVRVAIRAVCSPTTAEMRMISLSDEAAVRLSRWSGRLVALVGYNELLVVPIVAQNVSSLAARALSSFVALVAVLVVMALVVRYRRPVADWLGDIGGGRTTRVLARLWHWPVLLYLLALLIIVIARPGGVLFPILGGSAKILVAIVIGMIVTGALGRAMHRGVTLPDSVKTRLPLLERRLNAFVPKALFVLRLAVFAAVVLYAADVIGVAAWGEWLNSQVGAEVTGRLLSVMLMLVAAFLIWLALSSWVDYRLNPDYGGVATSREQTLLTLLRNAATIAIAAVTLMFVLSEIGVDIAPLLASAGVLGLAIGFGAQKMVQDIITGVFIQFENAINVGDVVTVGGTTGVVERLTIRSVSLRDLQGTYHVVPFSSVDMVANFNKGFAYYVMDIGIAYQEDVGEARAALEEAFERLRAEPENGPKVLGELEWFGLNSFGDSALGVRARVKTLPGQQWGVGRRYNEIVKQVFDERDIEIPFPHQTLYWGEIRKGRTPPLRVARQDAGPARPAPATAATDSGQPSAEVPDEGDEL